MAEITKTPTLGLNKPPKGYFDWDVPLNENWDKLDFLGAGQLPLLATHEFDHRLEGDEAIGWAMQGSILDGDEYTSVWEKLKTAKDRATQQVLEINSVTYTIFKDATSGWVFLDSANYNKAFTNLKDSLGFILVEADGNKTITLPKREVYTKPSMNDANVFGAESLPNIRGTAQARKLGVNPDHHTVFIYYKVGNTIVNQDQIDVGNLLTQVDNLATNKADKDLSNVSSNIDYVVESGDNYMKFKSGKLIQWGTQGLGNNQWHTVTLPKPYQDNRYSLSTACGVPRGYNSSAIIWFDYQKTSTYFKLRANGDEKPLAYWITIGQGV